MQIREHGQLSGLCAVLVHGVRVDAQHVFIAGAFRSYSSEGGVVVTRSTRASREVVVHLGRVCRIGGVQVYVELIARVRNDGNRGPWGVFIEWLSCVQPPVQGMCRGWDTRCGFESGIGIGGSWHVDGGGDGDGR